MDAGPNRDIDVVTEQVRSRLSRTITRRVLRKRSDAGRDAGRRGGKEDSGCPDQERPGRVSGSGAGCDAADHGQLGELRKKFQELSQTPIVLTSQVIRIYLSRMIAQFYPDVYVLSFSEITSNVQIQAIGNISLQPQQAQT